LVARALVYIIYHGVPFLASTRMRVPPPSLLLLLPTAAAAVARACV
jgi:hypothetical protein